MLKVVHIPFTFFPDPVGGTEIYVNALARELRTFGIDSIIAAPSSSGLDERYDYFGVRVYRYRWAKESKTQLRELYSDGDPEAGKAFSEILEQESPDIVHLHAATRAVSVHLVRAAKSRLIPVMFTYHTPTVSCQRGTLMRWGTDICDGVIEPRRCAECVLMGEGLPHWLSMPLSRVPSGIAKALDRSGRHGGVWTALRMTELMRSRRAAFNSFMQEVDGVVALREWIRALLIKNGVSDSKISVSQHGLIGSGDKSSGVIDVTSVPLRIAFFGRADRVKGIDVLVRAITAAPELAIELDLYCLVQQDSDHEYRALIEALIGKDRRIKFCAPLSQRQVIKVLSEYHLLAVPSGWLETGPLVVLESFAAGTPVIGSNLGGIAEWVQHERNGLLVTFDDAVAWTNALRRCVSDRKLLARLRQGVGTPRTMNDVTSDMAKLYKQLHPAKAERSLPDKSFTQTCVG